METENKVEQPKQAKFNEPKVLKIFSNVSLGGSKPEIVEDVIMVGLGFGKFEHALTFEDLDGNFYVRKYWDAIDVYNDYIPDFYGDDDEAAEVMNAYEVEKKGD
jgi:hypothetical protein